MSMHKKPLTDLEREGLIAHGFSRHIGVPSQLADAFRNGIAWAIANNSGFSNQGIAFRNVEEKHKLISEFVDESGYLIRKYEVKQ